MKMPSMTILAVWLLLGIIAVHAADPDSPPQAAKPSPVTTTVNLAPSLNGETLKKLALDALEAKYPEIEKTDLQLTAIDLSYGFTADWPLKPSEKACDPSVLYTFVILSTVEEGREKRTLADGSPNGTVPKVSFDTVQVRVYYERKPMDTSVFKTPMQSTLESTLESQAD